MLCLHNFYHLYSPHEQKSHYLRQYHHPSNTCLSLERHLDAVCYLWCRSFLYYYHYTSLRRYSELPIDSKWYLRIRMPTYFRSRRMICSHPTRWPRYHHPQRGQWPYDGQRRVLSSIRLSYHTNYDYPEPQWYIHRPSRTRPQSK